MSAENKYFRLQYPLSGVPVKNPPPSEPHRTIGPEKDNHKLILNITSRLGFDCERAMVGIWSGSIAPTLSSSERNSLDQSFKSVLNKLSPVQNKTIRRNNDLCSHYQKLTLAPEMPFVGDERTVPSEEDLAYIFGIVDEKFESVFGEFSLNNMFNDLGSEPSYIDLVNHKIRYPVEASLALARLLLDPPEPPKGKILGSQHYNIFHDHRVQFDGVVVPSKADLPNISEFSLKQYISEGHDWAAIQVKLLFKARYISGPKKLHSPRDEDIAQTEKQLAEVIVGNNEQEFNFPKFIQLVYLRGVQPPISHYVRFDYWRIREWRSELEEMFDNGFFTSEETQRESAHLLQVLTNEENKMHDEIIRKAEASKKITKIKDQLHFPYRYRLDL